MVFSDLGNQSVGLVGTLNPPIAQELPSKLMAFNFVFQPRITDYYFLTPIFDPLLVNFDYKSY